MSAYINTRKTGIPHTVSAGGRSLGKSSNAIELSEGRLPPVLYFPRADLDMACFERSTTTSHCPHKGQASYFSVRTDTGTIADAAWSYETPNPGLEEIAGHLAFYPGKVSIDPS